MKIILSVFAIIIFYLPTQLTAENYCGNLTGAAIYGPYDYNNPDHRSYNLQIVEGRHFTKNIENLDPSEGSLGGELAYTLRAFPNHSRALAAMSKLAIRDKTNKPVGSSHTVLCFFDRATRFRPKDAVVRSLFGSHLLKIGKPDLAFEQLVIASELEPDNPAFNYNLGLLYFDKKEYTRAREYAEKAYSQEFPLPGLKNKLQNAGKW